MMICLRQKNAVRTVARPDRTLRENRNVAQRKLGLSEPMRTLPLSLVAAGVVRAAGNAGLSEPMRTLPLSSVLVEVVRTAGKAGLSEPMRTLPLSSVLVDGVR